MQLPDDYIGELTRLIGLVLGQQDLNSTLQEITLITARLVPATEAVSITTFRDGRSEAVAFSDGWAKELDELQFEEREGPCLDATRIGNIFRIRDLETESRWPRWTDMAVKHGARSAVCIPLQAEGRNFGAMDLYARVPDAFSSEAVSFAEILAGQAGQASQVASAFFRHRDLADQMRDAMATRAVIEQAKGILMGQRGCSAEDAFDILVKLSQESNRKLRDVAQALLDQARTGRESG